MLPVFPFLICWTEKISSWCDCYTIHAAYYSVHRRWISDKSLTNFTYNLNRIILCTVPPPSPPLLHSVFLSPSLSLSLLHAVCVSLSRPLGVTTAAPQCVRKPECHVLTGVRGMLTGQTEGTDGGVTCPRSSGVPLSGALDLKPNTFFVRFFFFLSFFLSDFLLSPYLPPSLHPSFFLSPPSLASLSPTSFSVFHSLPHSPMPGVSLATPTSVYHLFPPQCRSQSLLYRLLPIST